MTDESPQPQKTVSFLTDDEGNPSSVRVLMTIAFAIAVLLSAGIVFDWIGETHVGTVKDLILYFLVAAFGGKSAQKFAEAMKAAKS